MAMGMRLPLGLVMAMRVQRRTGMDHGTMLYYNITAVQEGACRSIWLSPPPGEESQPDWRAHPMEPCEIGPSGQMTH